VDKTAIQRLSEFGQSAWLDNINRSMFKTGQLKSLIKEGLRGMTSNPTIFDKAISKSNIYDEDMKKLYAEGKSTFEIYDDLTIKDIQDATDAFKPVWDETKGLDGYVSLEINPKLAFSIQKTIEEGKRLHEKADRPNLMLKVPATNEGFEAIEELVACGMNVNATLIFSLEQYEKTADAYINGLERFLKDNGDVSKVRSVASVFVSRIDAVIDKALEELSEKEKDPKRLKEITLLKGKAAVSNCKFIYKKYLDLLSTDKWKNLEKKGANIQRVLWASTSTKSPSYSDIKYITELIAKGSVNTIPDATLKAFMGHGFVKEAVTSDTSSAEDVNRGLIKFGIKINEVLKKLLEKGVVVFEESFESLLDTIEENTKKFESKIKAS